jgi:LuxR family maltose regulon positive regulatory protein
MVELRAADLRFSLPEVTEFLNGIMGLGLDARAIAVLDERTEGWIAGLQMAALSLRSHNDIPGFIEGFSGTHRFILDYLLEEILAVQPQEVQEFLLSTSILNRLSAPLCDELLANGEPSPSVQTNPSVHPPLENSASQPMLDYLERANLFLVPLDDVRAWYRYHHLFADLLRARLEQVHPGRSRGLHARAAAWLERADMTVEAVNHRLSGGEYDYAARLVEENTTRLLARGELNALMAWIETLPAELRRTRPWLCIHQAYALIFGGRSEDVGPLLAQVEAALEAASSKSTAPISGRLDEQLPHRADAAESRALRGAVASLRAFQAAIMVQDTEALSLARRADELLEPGDLFNQSLVAWARGYALHSRGSLPEARAAFEEQVRLARSMRNNAALMIGVTALARVLGDQGSLREARALLEQTLDEADGGGARNQAFVPRIKAHLAGVFLEQNELGTAHQLLSDALADARFWLNANHLAFILSFLVRVLLAEGDHVGARDTLRELDRLRRTTQISRWLRCSLEAAIVRGCLDLQSTAPGLPSADPLAQESRLVQASWRSELAARKGSQDAAMDQCMVMALLAMARVSLASGEAAQALEVLDRLTRSSKATGHRRTAIESLVLGAVAWQARLPGRGAFDAALGRLEEALALAEPGGYVRIFVDEGSPVRRLLVRWLAQASAGSLRDYAARLLTAFDGPPAAPTRDFEAGSASSDIVEPLSPRELEVLQLVALGCTNQEIAQQLVVASGTVKAHTASIYRKLQVANRTQAVARARRLGLLP